MNRILHLGIGLLAASFVLTGLRRQTPFIMLEPWEIVMVICFGAWAVEIVRDRKVAIELDAIGLFALAVVVGAWMSFFGALDELTWFKRAMRITCLFGVYLFFVRHVRDERQLFALLRFMILACVAASLVLIGQVFQWIRTGADLERVVGGGFAGAFANHNEGSTYIAMCVALALPLWRRQGYESWMSGRGLAAVLGVCTIGTLAGQSRTGVIALAWGAAIAIVGGKRVGYLAAMATVVGILIWFLLSPSYLVARWLAAFGASGDSNLDAFTMGGVVVRRFLLEMYWEVIKTRPVFGIGAANYGFFEELHLNWPPVPAGASRGFESIDQYFGFSSHNGFLNWWAETGTVGFLPFLGSLIYSLWALWQLRCMDSLPVQWEALAVGTVAAINVFIVTNMTGDFGVSEARYWVLLAIASIVLRLLKLGRVEHKLFAHGERQRN